MANADRTVHIFFGFFFLINACIVVGFLSMPYVFFYSGYLAAVPTFFFIVALVLINAIYLLEVMARAQALEYLKTPQELSDHEEGQHHDAGLPAEPRFEVTVSRKFEVMELCEVFFNKWVKYLYLILLVLTTFLILWALSLVGGSSWALNIPYNFSGVVQCESDAFLHTLLPVEETCRNAYRFSLFLFALIVVTLSVLDLKEQAFVQMFLGLLRFVLILAIVIYSTASITQDGGDSCFTSALSTNNMLNINNLSITNTDVKDIIFKLDLKSWLTSVPVISYAFAIHPTIPTLTHPIRQKKHLHHLIIAVFCTCGICYLLVGVIAPLRFKANTQETVTLNFVKLTSSDHSIALRLLAYFIILFPTLDAISASPLGVHVVVNHIYAVITGYDTSIRPSSHSRTKKWLDIIMRVSLRLIIAVLPIMAAFFVSNLVDALKYGGLVAFSTSLFFPTALQLRSIYVCKKVFTSSGTPRQVQDKEERELLLSNHLEDSQKKSITPLKGRSKYYMTPFSSQVFSHPVTVVIVGIFDVCLFVLGVANVVLMK